MGRAVLTIWRYQRARDGPVLRNFKLFRYFVGPISVVPKCHTPSKFMPNLNKVTKAQFVDSMLGKVLYISAKIKS